MVTHQENLRMDSIDRAAGAPVVFLVRSLVAKIRTDPTAGNPEFRNYRTGPEITLYDPLRRVPHDVVAEELINRLLDTTPKEFELIDKTVHGLTKGTKMLAPGYVKDLADISHEIGWKKGKTGA